jgi:hypothetical protein
MHSGSVGSMLKKKRIVPSYDECDDDEEDSYQTTDLVLVDTCLKWKNTRHIIYIDFYIYIYIYICMFYSRYEGPMTWCILLNCSDGARTHGDFWRPLSRSESSSMVST